MGVQPPLRKETPLQTILEQVSGFHVTLQILKYLLILLLRLLILGDLVLQDFNDMLPFLILLLQQFVLSDQFHSGVSFVAHCSM